MSPAEAKKRIEALSAELKKHSYEYYVLAMPSISDFEFDKLLEERYDYFIYWLNIIKFKYYILKLKGFILALSERYRYKLIHASWKIELANLGVRA